MLRRERFRQSRCPFKVERRRARGRRLVEQFFTPNSRKESSMSKFFTRALLCCAVAAALSLSAHAQTHAPSTNNAATQTAAPNNPTDAATLDAVRKQLQEQQAEI